MTQGTPGLRLMLLVAGDFAAAAAAAGFSLLLAIALSSGKGSGAAGSVMMAVLAGLALLLLALLPAVFFLARRWSGRSGLAFGLAALAGLAHGALWVVTLLGMAVVLNR